jgi:sulfonate transport system ATP-binding protein
MPALDQATPADSPAPATGSSPGAPDAVRPAVPVRCRQVSKAFPGRNVLHHLDLDVAPGEAVAIVGRSGCGKSTLLRLLTGLEPPSSGDISIADRPLTGLNPHVRVMFQDPCLFPWRTVQGNVALGVPRAHRDLADWALAQVGLADRVGDWPKNLSGGQRQRVSLARALASRPGLLLLDEPLGALDALTRLEMQRLLARIRREQGFTLILVTHDADEAVLLADRVLVMDHGRWVADIAVGGAGARDRDSPHFIALRGRVLAAVMGRA